MWRLVSNARGPWPNLSQVDRLSQQDLLHIYDAFDETVLGDILISKGYPAHVFQDSYTFYQGNFPCQFWCADLWLGTELAKFADVERNDVETKYAANFIINKKQINRFLAIKLVEYFEIDCHYTWSGVDANFDMSGIINELKLLPDHKIPTAAVSWMLSPIKTAPRWIDHPAQKSGGFGITNYGTNRWTWDNGIGKIVSGSAVSLITESQRFEKAIHFSEKTAYAMLGQTFPIWIGGYRQAQEWEKLGFDVFHDVIDHSYQFYDTLIQRCWHAFADNSKLLTDLNKLARVREKMSARLQDNFNRVTDNIVRNHNQKIITAWPDHVKNAIKPIVSTFFQNHLLE